MITITICIIVNKLFPEKVESFEKDPLKDLRGGSKAYLAKLLYDKILKNRTLKIGLITLFL